MTNVSIKFDGKFIFMYYGSAVVTINTDINMIGFFGADAKFHYATSDSTHSALWLAYLELIGGNAL